MVLYNLTQQTHIITVDDVNTTYYISRTEDNESKNYSVLKKINNLLKLTNAYNKFNIATVISTLEIAIKYPGKNTENKIHALMYQLNDNTNNFYIEPIIAASRESAANVFDERIKNYKNIKEDSISYFQIGKASDSVDKEDIESTRYKINITELEETPLIIESKLDAFSEFHRKVFKCTFSTELVPKESNEEESISEDMEEVNNGEIDGEYSSN